MDPSVGSILSRSFAIMLRNFVPFVALNAIVQLPVLLMYLYATSDSATLNDLALVSSTSGLLSMLLGNVATGAVTYGTFMQLRGDHASIGRSIGVGFSRLLPVLGVGIGMALIIGLGFILLIIPGIILTCMLFVSVPSAVVERPGFFGAFRRSRELTSGHRWTVFGLLVVLVLIGIGLTVIADIVFATEGDTAADQRMLYIATWITGTIVGTWQAVAGSVVYHDLRVAKEGVAVEELAAVFD